MTRAGVEGRSSPRFEVRLSAEVRSQGHRFTAITRNLSTGGVCLESRFPLEEGGVVQVALFLVEDDVEDAIGAPLELSGEIAWSAPGEGSEPSIFGVRFGALTPVQSRGLARFLEATGQTG